LQIEQRVPLIPVPRSSAKSAVLRRVLLEPVTPANERSPAEAQKLRPFVQGFRPRDRATQKIALATALAAGLIVFAVGFWALQHSPKESVKTSPYSQTLAAILAQHKANLEAAAKPGEKVKVFEALVEKLHTETTSSASDLKALSRVYKRVVGEELVQQAREVSPGERAQLLGPIILQLEATANEAMKLAQATSPEAATPLLDIAQAANDARGQLRNLTATASG
jgi:hypothetical protein